MAIGYIYILSNSAMGALLKIGFTCGSVERRVKELSGATGVPGKFVIEFFQLTDDVEEREAQIHAELASFRYNGNREFFSLPFDDAVAAVKRCITEPPLRFIKAQARTEIRSCRRCGAQFLRSDEQRLCPQCGF